MPNYTNFVSDEFIRHEFLKDEYCQNNQTQLTLWQKIGTKRQSEFWNKFVSNRTTIFSLDCCRQAIFAETIFVYLISHSAETIITQTVISEKRSNQYTYFNYVNTDNTFQKTKFTFSKAILTTDKTILPSALCTVKLNLVLKWVNRANPKYFNCFRINEISNFGAAMIIHVFNTFLNRSAKILAMLWPFWKPFAPELLGRVFGSSMWSKKTLLHTILSKSSVHQNAWFVFLYDFGGRQEKSWTFLYKGTINSLLTFLYATSIATTMQNMLLQKSTDLKMEGRMICMNRQNCGPFTWPSKNEFSSHTMLYQ